MSKFDALLNNIESSKNIYSLLKNLQDNKKLENKVWGNFCEKAMKQSLTPKKKYFRKHPNFLSNSNSDFLSESSSNESIINKGKTIQNHEEKASVGSIHKSINSESSFECVTIRKETKTCLKNTKSKNALIKNATARRDKMDIERKIIDKQTSKKVKIKPSVQHDENDASMDINRKSFSKNVNTCVSKELTNGKLLVKKETSDMGDTIRDNIDLKIKHVLNKTLNCIEDIRSQIDAGIRPPDGADDYERRRKRANEFASRFARNYLYQLNRQVNEIHVVLKPKSGRMSFRSHNNLQQKIVSSYQTILQGLQAYCSHLPTSVGISVPEKVKEMLKQSLTLYEIHRSSLNIDVNSNDKKDDIIDAYEFHCKNLLKKLEDSCGLHSVVSLVHSNHSKHSLVGCNEVKDSNMQRKKNAMKSRFSMYSGMSARKDVYWKRAVAAMAKKKFNVTSKYKTAHFKHRPPYEKPVVTKPPSKHKVVERKSSGHLKVKSAMNDDTVMTMVQLQKQKEHDLGIKESVSGSMDVRSSHQIFDIRNSILTPLVDKVLEKINEQKKDMSQDQIKNILQGLVEMVQSNDANQVQKTNWDVGNVDESMVNKMNCRECLNSNEILEKLVSMIKNHKDEEHEEVPKDIDESSCTAEAKTVDKKRKERKKTITVSGARNAQLICIRDDDSLTIPPEVPLPEEKHSSIQNDLKITSEKQEAAEKSLREEKCTICNKIAKSEILVKTKSSNEFPTSYENKSNLNMPSEIPSNVSVGSPDRITKMKISRIPKRSLRCLQMLPKEYTLNVLQYKIQFLKSKKGNHMYKKSDTTQPWELMGLVADNILEELLVGIGQEIQLNEVIDKIYQSELIL